MEAEWSCSSIVSMSAMSASESSKSKTSALAKMRWLCRFRDDTDALLDEVAEADLRFSAYILFCQLLHNLTVQIKTSCERRIRLNGDSM